MILISQFYKEAEKMDRLTAYLLAIHFHYITLEIDENIIHSLHLKTIEQHTRCKETLQFVLCFVKSVCLKVYQINDLIAVPMLW